MIEFLKKDNSGLLRTYIEDEIIKGQINKEKYQLSLETQNTTEKDADNDMISTNHNEKFYDDLEYDDIEL